MTDAIAALLLQALEAQCEESGGGLVMVRSDDLTSVEIEGSFDLRGLAIFLVPAMAARETGADQFDVQIGCDENGFLRLRRSPAD